MSYDIQRMWKELTQEEQNTMITLAKTGGDMIGSDDSNLSEDLAVLAVEPIVPLGRPRLNLEGLQDVLENFWLEDVKLRNLNFTW